MSSTSELKELTHENIEDVICCPGGAEVRQKDFCCDISPVLEWKEDMLESGMEGLVLYQEGEPIGFAEYMPVENAPYPIEGDDIAVIMCFHWYSNQERDEDEHHTTEKYILKAVIEEIRSGFKGATTLAWDHPVHFPIDMFEELGFSEIDSEEYISLMWLPLDKEAERPSIIGPNFEPSDMSNSGKLSVECGYSRRCPYSLHDYHKVKTIISDMDTDDDRIVFKAYKIDTRKDAINISKSPWTWDWLFLNGREVDHMKKDKNELNKMIIQELENLESM